MKEILNKFTKNNHLKFVVIASCHSERLGDIFFQAGVEHVICVNKLKEIKDKAAIKFSRTFYSSVFGSENTICAAFYSAQHSVEAAFSKEEASKLKLFTPANHCCKGNPVYRAMGPGSIEFIGKIDPYVMRIPNRVGSSYGRNEEMFHILTLLQSNI